VFEAMRTRWMGATYAGEFPGSVANFLAAKVEARTAMIADSRR